MMRRIGALFAAAALLLATRASAQSPPTWNVGFGNVTPPASAAFTSTAIGTRGVIAGGTLSGQVDLGAGALRARGAPDGIVGSYVAGVASWVLQLGGAGAAVNVTGVTTDTNGDVYAVGWFTSSVTSSGTPGAPIALATAGGSDVFVLKLSGATGAPMWAVRDGGAGQDKAYAIALDTSGDIAIAGWFTGTALFAGQALASAGSSDIFVATYAAANGAPRWAIRYGAAGADQASALAADTNGIYVAGAFAGTIDFGSGPMTAAATDAFLLALTNAGAPRWGRSVSSPGPDSANAVATAPSGHVSIAGGAGSTTDSIQAPFIATYAADGTLQWAARYAPASAPVFGGVARGLAAGPDGALIMTGVIVDDLNFGGGPLTAPYSPDVFLASFNASGG
ncbi:MAG TPA: SBBP repeat-containing protein, partial [Terriglobales bacterium]|nr:SBBP repeat-containing protein [Terriglobales bacterium]